MGTAEILIVFSALMALIALVTIGIDWIGKPLKNRRFIPRIYRFEDEKLPVDAYGHTDFSAQIPAGSGEARPVRQRRVARAATPTIRPRNQPAPRTVAQVPQVAAVPHAVHAAHGAPAAAARTASTASAFSDSLDDSRRAPSGIAGATAAEAPNAPASSAREPWRPGMALDRSVDDRKPNLATKAERFWKTTAQELDTAGATSRSHFDVEDIARMAAGKAPRRTNPRNGRTESMQLTGLRRASSHTDVRMRWPDDAVDPWNAS